MATHSMFHLQQILEQEPEVRSHRLTEGLSYQPTKLLIAVLNVSEVGTCALPVEEVRCLWIAIYTITHQMSRGP